MTRGGAILLVVAALVATSPPPVYAADNAAPRPGAVPSAPTKPETAPTPASPPEKPPPYEGQLLRMAELMGALAYLRDLCGNGDGDKFRAKMSALVQADGISETRRDLLAAAYNTGFAGYKTTYRVCTPAAEEVISRYLAEVARLASDVASRYGG